MKNIWTQAIGGDGGEVELNVDGAMLSLSVEYPVAKIIAPVGAWLETMKPKIVAVIPNAWLAGLVSDAYDRLVAEGEELLTDLIPVDTPAAPAAQ